jgi:cell division protein FtsB
MPAINEKLKEARDWATLGLSLLAVLILPAGLLVLKNQRLEMAAEVRREYVSVETYRAGVAAVSAENSALKAEIAILNGKMDKLQITIVRLTDAIKLRDP